MTNHLSSLPIELPSSQASPAEDVYASYIIGNITSDSFATNKQIVQESVQDDRNLIAKRFENAMNSADPELLRSTMLQILLQDKAYMEPYRLPPGAALGSEEFEQMVLGTEALIDYFIGFILSVPDSIFLIHEWKIFKRPQQQSSLVFKFSFTGNQIYERTLQAEQPIITSFQKQTAVVPVVPSLSLYLPPSSIVDQHSHMEEEEDNGDDQGLLFPIINDELFTTLSAEEYQQYHHQQQLQEEVQQQQYSWDDFLPIVPRQQQQQQQQQQQMMMITPTYSSDSGFQLTSDMADMQMMAPINNNHNTNNNTANNAHPSLEQPLLSSQYISSSSSSSNSNYSIPITTAVTATAATTSLKRKESSIKFNGQTSTNSNSSNTPSGGSNSNSNRSSYVYGGGAAGANSTTNNNSNNNPSKHEAKRRKAATIGNYVHVNKLQDHHTPPLQEMIHLEKSVLASIAEPLPHMISATADKVKEEPTAKQIERKANKQSVMPLVTTTTTSTTASSSATSSTIALPSYLQHLHHPVPNFSSVAMLDAANTVNIRGVMRWIIDKDHKVFKIHCVHYAGDF